MTALDERRLVVVARWAGVARRNEKRAAGHGTGRSVRWVAVGVAHEACAAVVVVQRHLRRLPSHVRHDVHHRVEAFVDALEALGLAVGAARRLTGLLTVQEEQGVRRRLLCDHWHRAVHWHL